MIYINPFLAKPNLSNSKFTIDGRVNEKMDIQAKYIPNYNEES